MQLVRQRLACRHSQHVAALEILYCKAFFAWHLNIRFIEKFE
jgi:hypothetical protein